MRAILMRMLVVVNLVICQAWIWLTMILTTGSLPRSLNTSTARTAMVFNLMGKHGLAATTTNFGLRSKADGRMAIQRPPELKYYGITPLQPIGRSEERRVGKGWVSK